MISHYCPVKSQLAGCCCSQHVLDKCWVIFYYCYCSQGGSHKGTTTQSTLPYTARLPEVWIACVVIIALGNGWGDAMRLRECSAAVLLALYCCHPGLFWDGGAHIVALLMACYLAHLIESWWNLHWWANKAQSPSRSLTETMNTYNRKPSAN